MMFMIFIDILFIWYMYFFSYITTHFKAQLCSSYTLHEHINFTYVILLALFIMIFENEIFSNIKYHHFFNSISKNNLNCTWYCFES